MPCFSNSPGDARKIARGWPKALIKRAASRVPNPGASFNASQSKASSAGIAWVATALSGYRCCKQNVKQRSASAFVFNKQSGATPVSQSSRLWKRIADMVMTETPITAKASMRGQ
jgi:hypothetical protein